MLGFAQIISWQYTAPVPSQQRLTPALILKYYNV